VCEPGQLTGVPANESRTGTNAGEAIPGMAVPVKYLAFIRIAPCTVARRSALEDRLLAPHMVFSGCREIMVLVKSKMAVRKLAVEKWATWSEALSTFPQPLLLCHQA